MKSVLISIQPKWVEKIASGEKTIEVRKSRPKIETLFKCYIYMTQGKFKDLGTYSDWIYQNRMRVIGEFVCDRIDDLRYVPTKYYLQTAVTWEEMICNSSCLSVDQIKEYAKGKAVYGWHISDLKIYDKPKELSEFSTYAPEYTVKDGSKYGRVLVNPLKRPPQSWCYVESLGE